MTTHARAQAGDTIVEVIIAVVIVATVLTGAFLVTSRSTRAVRDSEEHAEALQLLQGQVELLRHAAATPGSLPAALNTPFCLSASAFFQPAGTNPQCTVNNLYSLSITSPVSAPAIGSTTTFNLVATWIATNGDTDNVLLSYKVEVAP